MPSFTPADALIKAANNLVDTINGIMPKNKVTSDAVEQLMEIYKIQAEKATCKERTQRVLREQAQAQRVEEQQLAVEQQASPLNTPTSIHEFEVDPYPNINIGSLRGTPVISQDDEEDTSHPAVNTRQQHQMRTLTQDYMLHMWKYQATQPLSPQNKLRHGPSPYNSSAILHMQSSMTTPATYSSTATSSSIQNTRTHGVTHSERKSDD